MSFTLEPRAELRDVTLRDGLQLTGKMLSTERKVETVRELLRLGVPSIELGSMARADLVPTMANTLEVVQALTAEELQKCWIWVATPGHVAKAAAAGARNFQYCLSASDSHNQANIGRSTDASLAALPEAYGTALREAFAGASEADLAVLVEAHDAAELERSLTRMGVDHVDLIRFAGAFGSFIDPKYAMVLGLILELVVIVV